MFVHGDVVASITVDIIFIAVVIAVDNVYLAVDVTTVDVVFFATAIVVVTVAVGLITADTVSLGVITVIFVVVFVPTIRIDVVCHAVINVVIVDFFVNIMFADEILQLRAKFPTVMVSCSRFIWITNSSDHRRG